LCRVQPSFIPVLRQGDTLPGRLPVISYAAASVSQPALALERVVAPPLPNARALFVKRTLDILLASTALVILAPLLVLIALAIVLDMRGPVLFRQERVGKDGRTFVMLKFRTMVADRRSRAIGVPVGMRERRRVHKSPHDPRITRVGRILRRTCLDELPQLLNVLRGEMSMVGPRPELLEIVAQYDQWQHARHLVVPGITGWWQVNRKGTMPMHQATELDLYYIEHWSFAFDLGILLRTVAIVLRGVGAY
jgi:exopolysaccharide biosynthesis polyprenyl glycosylphosphotransferase